MKHSERVSSRVEFTPEYEQALAERADRWVAACGGAEVPFEHQGGSFLYVWNPATGEHGYLNLGTDIVSPNAPWERAQDAPKARRAPCAGLDVDDDRLHDFARYGSKGVVEQCVVCGAIREVA